MAGRRTRTDGAPPRPSGEERSTFPRRPPLSAGRRTGERADGAHPQLVLDLALRTAQGVEDFFVSASNAAAVDLIDRWPDWPLPAAVLCGPEGSGKSHLAHIWQVRASAAAVAAPALQEPAARDIEDRRPWLVEDLDRGTGDERALFHMLNLARENGTSLLLTSRVPPGALTIALPDLRSRLNALPAAHIAAPDSALLAAMMLKLFADRQIAIAPPVAAYLLARAPRSAAAVCRLVALIDEMSLSLRRRVTRPLAAAALARLAQSSRFSG